MTLLTRDRTHRIEDVLQRICDTVPVHSVNSRWIVYGSFALGQTTARSDIDLMHVVRSGVGLPSRVGLKLDNRPVTVYTLTRQQLWADGEERRFGGYFIGKCLGPHFVFPHDSSICGGIARAAGKFIAPFAGALVRSESLGMTKRHISAACFRAMLKVCPWYLAYLARYVAHPQFPELWQAVADFAVDALIQSGEIRLTDQQVFQFLRVWKRDELQREMIATIARFWALGACLHGADPRFPDFYIAQATDYLVKHKSDAKTILDGIRELEGRIGA